MQIISKSQLKTQLLEHLRRVESDKVPLIVTHGGKPVIKISSYNEDPEKILTALSGSVISFIDPTLPVGQTEWEGLS